MDTSAIGVQGIESICADQGVGQAVVFIHGWGGWHRYWRHLWPRFVPRFRALAPDLPGFGWSGKPHDAPYTMEWFADWIAALLDAKGIDRAVLVGHSMGGGIALLAAARHPSRVSRLVLVNPMVHGASAWDGRTRFISSRVMRPLMYGLTRFDGGLALVGEGFTNTRPMEMDDLGSIRMATFRSLSASLASLRTMDALASAGQVTAPTLVVRCALDRVVDPEQGARASRAIAGARLETLPTVGHCVQLEAPEALTGVLMEFLRDVPRPGRPRQW